MMINAKDKIIPTLQIDTKSNCKINRRSKAQVRPDAYARGQQHPDTLERSHRLQRCFFSAFVFRF